MIRDRIAELVAAPLTEIGLELNIDFDVTMQLQPIPQLGRLAMTVNIVFIAPMFGEAPMIHVEQTILEEALKPELIEDHVRKAVQQLRNTKAQRLAVGQAGLHLPPIGHTNGSLL